MPAEEEAREERDMSKSHCLVWCTTPVVVEIIIKSIRYLPIWHYYCAIPNAFDAAAGGLLGTLMDT